MQLRTQQLIQHQTKLSQCSVCENMQGPPVCGKPVASSVLLIGQAPGIKEIEVHRPFAWQAGKTLFSWFNQINVNENRFRENIYMSAVCRCFPGRHINGKALKSGDRAPNKAEIANCRHWMNTELSILQPELIIPVGKLAISQFLDFTKLTEVIGSTHQLKINNINCDIIPLPHPSGASTWPRIEPGKSLLRKALQQINVHPAWQQTFDNN